MAWALVQTTPDVNANGAASQTCTYGATPTQNNLLVLACAQHAATNLLATPSGWSVAAQLKPGNAVINVFYKVAGASEPTGVTVSTSSGTESWEQRAWEYSGNATSSVLDVAATAAVAFNSTATTASITTTGSSDLLFAAIAQDDGPGLGTYGNAWTNSFTNLSEVVWLAAADRRGVAVGSYSTSETITPNHAFATAIVSFKASAAATAARQPIVAPSRAAISSSGW